MRERLIRWLAGHRAVALNLKVTGGSIGPLHQDAEGVFAGNEVWRA